VTQLLSAEGLTVNASYITSIANAVVAILNVQQATPPATTPAAA
jgi:hypothetical protein